MSIQLSILKRCKRPVYLILFTTFQQLNLLSKAKKIQYLDLVTQIKTMVETKILTRQIHPIKFHLEKKALLLKDKNLKDLIWHC